MQTWCATSFAGSISESEASNIGNLDDHFQFVMYGTSNTLNAYMCSKGTSD